MSETTVFTKDMTVAEALALHPRAREVFAGYHLGGCSHCSISEYETVAQICEGYGVPVESILESLNGLKINEEKA
jgi:hybrid cluster-associated redox disulfide protein